MPLKIICYNCSQKLDVSEVAPFTKIQCPVCEVPIIVPKPFGNLLLEENLGEGTLTQVYRAMDITLDREIAVKVLKKEFVDADLSQAFINEARSSSAINHPSIIPIYSCGEMEDKPYIIMQYMEGLSLKHKLKKGILLPIPDICRYFSEAAAGLEFAGVQGVSHGNIKPSNIFLDMDANIKVGDFGLTRIIETSQPLYQNNTLSPLVTLEMSYYLSPEQISTGKHDLTSDIFSFGATLYHVLTGSPPYTRDSAIENIRAHFEGPPKPPVELRSDVPEELNKLIIDMLSIYPSNRPRSFREVQDCLTKITSSINISEKKDDASARDVERPLIERKIPSIRQVASQEEQVKRTNRGKTQQPIVVRDADDSTEADRDGVDKTPAGILEEEGHSILYSLLYYVPIVIIVLSLILFIAHTRNIPIYNRTLRPYVEKILGIESQSDASESTPLKVKPLQK